MKAFRLQPGTRSVEASDGGASASARQGRGETRTMLDAWIFRNRGGHRRAARRRPIGDVWTAFWTLPRRACETPIDHGRDTWKRQHVLGERSLDHMDPGAASSVIILRRHARRPD